MNHLIISKPLLNSIPEDLIPLYDPVYVQYYNKYSAGRLATHQVPIEAYRADPGKYTISYGREIVPSDGVRFKDEQCPVEGGYIIVRIYERDSESPTASRRPVYINFHGGGWVFGGLATDFDFCKRIVRHLDCVVFDVDYRLAPEHPYPVPVDDCIAALHWIRKKQDQLLLDLDRVAIGGCSAGGHLSAVIAHICRDLGIPLALQILSVPVIDLNTLTPEGAVRSDCPYPSYRDLAYNQPLPLERIAWFYKAFLGFPRPDKWESDWKISPMMAPNFKGLAPALVLTAEMDILRDEGETYAAKLKKGGCEVELVRFKGAPHTFMQLDAILDSGKAYNEKVLAALKMVFRM